MTWLLNSNFLAVPRLPTHDVAQNDARECLTAPGSILIKSYIKLPFPPDVVLYHSFSVFYCLTSSFRIQRTKSKQISDLYLFANRKLYQATDPPTNTFQNDLQIGREAHTL